MDRMLYVAMSGAKETLIAQANASNNLANANTTGFLQDLNQFRSMPVSGAGQPTRVFAMDERPTTDFAPGATSTSPSRMGAGWRCRRVTAARPTVGAVICGSTRVACW
jgi:flagellar basal body rod protein FlgF